MVAANQWQLYEPHHYDRFLVREFVTYLVSATMANLVIVLTFLLLNVLQLTFESFVRVSCISISGSSRGSSSSSSSRRGGDGGLSGSGSGSASARGKSGSGTEKVGGSDSDRR